MPKAITPDLPIAEPDNSPKLRDDQLAPICNDDTSSDDDDFEDIEYVSLEEILLNINRLIANIESLNDNLTPDCVLKSPSSFPILVTDSDSFFEESDTFFSHLDYSLPETFSNHTDETRSGSTTTHANNSLPEEVRLMFLKMLKLTIPSHWSFGLFSRFSPTLWILLYFSSPEVKTPFLTPASPLRAGGISSGWNFHVL
ncbi:hypothetical protein Tco_1540591 [Tanacetum coccineum]